MKKRVIVKFETFWKAYPKHAKRPAALSAWKKVKPDETTFLMILNAIEIQKKQGGILAEQADTGDKYIPHAASWLYNRRWEEVLSDSDIAGIDKPVEFEEEEVIELGIYPELTGGVYA